MFDEIKKTDEKEKDTNIDRILNSMAYGQDFKYTYEDLFGKFDERSTSYQYLMLNEVHDEMVYEDLITSQKREDTKTDKKYRLISLTIRGYQIKKKGGWIKYKKGLKTTFVDGQIVKWSIVFVTLGSFVILVWSEFIKKSVPSDLMPIEAKKSELKSTQPPVQFDSTRQDSTKVE